MASLNKVFLMGNLTRDPEVRYTPGGAAVCELGLAVNRRYTSNNQEHEEVCFIDVVVWGKQAESSGRYLEKGAPVLIEGRLQLDQWQDKNSGANRSKLRVVAERVQFLSRNSERRDAAPGGQQQYGGGYNSSYQQQGGYQGGNSAPQSPQGYYNPPPAAPQPPPAYNKPQGPAGGPPEMPDKAFNDNVQEGAADDIPF
jgi:single-strand DNA-binding protein